MTRPCSPPFGGIPSCQLCPLHEEAQAVCIPSRQWPDNHLVNRRHHALLLLGEAPAREECLQGKPFVGESGQLLDRWLTSCQLRGVEVFLGNVVRCPRGATTLTAKHWHACRRYLDQDLDVILRLFSGRLTILCLGTTATQALLGFKLTATFHRQGQPLELSYQSGLNRRKVQVPVFSTYHPAYLLPGRNTAAADAVADHLNLLCHHLSGEEINPGTDITPLINPRTSECLAQEGQLVSLDIETYGISEEYPPQTVFHISKALAVDHIPVNQSVLCASLAWESDRGMKAAWFDLQDPEGLWAFNAYLSSLYSRKAVLLLQNAGFDLTWLRRFLGAGKFFLSHKGLQVEDLMAWNYLDSDVRPERGLKSLSALFNVASYNLSGGKTFRRYPSHRDPDCIRYNVQDAVATLRLRNRLFENITQRYPETAKLSNYTRGWYSKLIWLAVYLTENGTQYSSRRLKRLAYQTAQEMNQLVEESNRGGFRIAGPGSKKPIQQLFNHLVEQLDLLRHPELELTEKRRDISTSEANINLLLEHLPGGETPEYQRITSLKKFRGAQKLYTTYLRPLVGSVQPGEERGRDPTQALLHGRAYSTWFVVPTGESVDASKSALSGGTKQARITCKRPAQQTMNKDLKACRTSRWCPGAYLSRDLSQIEMVMAGVISGDPLILTEYRQGVDRHWLMALRIWKAFGRPICSRHGSPPNRQPDCPDCELARFVGKTSNFLILYRGEAPALRQTLREEVGYHVSLEEARIIIQAARRPYPVFCQWQDRRLREVTKRGWIADPILGQGRRFTSSGRVNRSDWISTIANFDIQLTAANLMLEPQCLCEFEFRASRLRARTCLNTYDATDVDLPLAEQPQVLDIMNHHFTDNEYRRRVEARYKVEIPLSWDDHWTYRLPPGMAPPSLDQPGVRGVQSPDVAKP